MVFQRIKVKIRLEISISGGAQDLIFSISWAVYTPTSLAIRIAMYNCPNSPSNMAKLRAAALTGARSPNPTDVRAMKLKYSNTA